MLTLHTPECYSQRQKKEHKQSNPLVINDEDIVACYDSPIEYQFVQDETLFIRNGGGSKAKQREKHLLIYNPDKYDHINSMIPCNHTVRQDMVIVKDESNTSHTISGREVCFQVMTNGCTFSNVEINDPECNHNYRFRICILDITPVYLENIHTCYKVEGSGKTGNFWPKVLKVSL